MNTAITKGKFKSNKMTYISKNGFHYYWFDFVDKGSHVAIFCNKHPSYNFKSRKVTKTHLYSSGLICFVKGKEPRSQWEAQRRAKEWAEYFSEYRRTGRAQS